MSIIVYNLSYIHPDKEILFQHINFSLSSGQKASLIGNNGSGKSTLLRILGGELNASEGEISYSEKPYYIPQHFGQYDHLTISQALRVDDKLRALYAILNGDVSVDNLDSLNDDWDIENRIKTVLQYWNLHEIELSQKMGTLSGGEKTKVFLSAVAIHTPAIILLDEPSNHLDSESRDLLYEFIRKSKSTMLIVSHDRTLLNLLNSTIELKNNNVDIYGGNYDFYEIQKLEKMNALQVQLNEKEKTLKQMKQKAKDIAEQKQKNDVRGKKQKQKAGIPRIAMGTLKDKAEQTGAKLRNIQGEKLDEITNSIKEIREFIGEQTVLKIGINDSDLYKGKILIEAKQVNFSYAKALLWKKALSFSIRSGDRIKITGNNGSGKTTLIKMMIGAIEPISGVIEIMNFNYLYIDQEYSIINNELSVFEQVESFNDRHLLEHELKMLLHRYQFSNGVWDRKCIQLSGGEKMKLLLCCLSISNNMPDVLILDEPTNNLDIYSQKNLVSAVKNFSGTVIAISHDQDFIEQIGINQTIEVC